MTNQLSREWSVFLRLWYTKTLLVVKLHQQRHRSDNQVNNRKSLVLRHGVLAEEHWHKVVVGDIIKMEDNQFVAVIIVRFVVSCDEFGGFKYWFSLTIN